MIERLKDWAFIALILFVVLVWMALASGITQQLISPQLDRIEGQIKRQNEQIRQIKSTVDTTIPAQFDRLKQEIQNEINKPATRRNIRLRLAVNRGGSYIDRLDSLLKGSPMAGLGREFYLAATENRIDWRLSAAITGWESRFGRHTPLGSHNGGGMTAGTAPGYGVAMGRGPDGTRAYQAFPSWRAYIRAHAGFIAKHWGPGAQPESMRGYAVSGGWSSGVRSIMVRI